MGLFGDVLGFIGGNKDRTAQAKANDQNAALQREFAQHGIRWKVEDAKAAGVHPLVALGAPVTPATASYQSASSGDAWRSAGNAIDRAVQAKTTGVERLNERLLSAQIDGQEVDNAMKRSQLARLNSSQLPPPLPSGRPSDGAGPEYASEGYALNPDGSIDITPSPDFAMANQNVISGIVPELKHFWRNQLYPSIEDFVRPIFGKGYKMKSIGGKPYYRRGSSWYPYKN